MSERLYTKKEILDMVGEDWITKPRLLRANGYNTAKQEIRDRINGRI